jgi:cell division protein FtsB
VRTPPTGVARPSRHDIGDRGNGVRRVWWLLAMVVVVFAGITLLAVFPARTWFAQRHDLAAAGERVEVLAEQNSELSERVKRLHTDAEIERLAREQYDLVKPGEEAYAILPAPESDTPKPKPKAVAKDEPGFWSKVGDTLSFWN